MSYFRELENGITSQWWYSVLRTLFTMIAGLALFFSSENVLEWLLPLVGVMLILDGVLMMVDVLITRTFRPLWKMLLAREAVQFFIAFALIFNASGSFVLLAFILAVLLFLRGIVELVLFVEVETTVHHRRLLLLTTVIFFLSSISIFIDIFTRTVGEGGIFGIYLIVMSVSHFRTAYRLRETPAMPKSEISEDYGVPILTPESAGSATIDAVNIDPEPAPAHQDDHERFVLVPHLNLEKYRKCVVFAPHPDDLEGFTGGLVYRLNAEVVSVVFAGGDKGVWQKKYKVVERDDYIQIRLDESSQAGQLLGVSQIIYMGYFDKGVVVDEEGIQRVLAMLELHKPDLVLSFEYRRRMTPYPHHDHLGTGNLVREAAIRSDLDFDLLLASTLIPNTFVDVTAARKIKLAALAVHTTQSQLNSIIFPFFEKLLSRLWGSFAGVIYAEGYRKVNLEKLRAARKATVHD